MRATVLIRYSVPLLWVVVCGCVVEENDAAFDPAKFAPDPDTITEATGTKGISYGSWCVEPFCSKTYNASDLGVYVGHDWLCDGTTGTARDESCVASTPRRWIYHGERTPSGEDWDSLRVDAGWCYKVDLNTGYKWWTVVYDRSNLSAVWVKVEDHAIATVQAQRYGSCP
jgi:hypothetical protein